MCIDWLAFGGIVPEADPGSSTQNNGSGGRGVGPDDFTAAALSMKNAGAMLRLALMAGISQPCQSDLTAMGVTAAQVITGAGSLAGNIYDGWGNTTNYAQAAFGNTISIGYYAGLYGGTTVGQFFAANPGTVAVSQLSGQNIYIDPTWVNSMDAVSLEALVFHELIHNLTGNVDPTIQIQLFGKDSQEVGAASVNIANKLGQDRLNLN